MRRKVISSLREACWASAQGAAAHPRNGRFAAGRILALSLLAACGGGSSEDPCEGQGDNCVAVPAGADRQAIQELLIEVESGQTLAFPAGTFEIDGEISLDVPGVTVRGAGMDETVLSFAAQATGAQGFLVTADDFTIEDIGLEDSPGDLLKIEGADGVTIRRVRAEWTNGPAATNGAYALYPVQCSNVLIEDSKAIAASDAGVYVGQSNNIIVTGNEAMFNVAGIEIENSSNADVFDNVAHDNTGGMLVFNLPGRQIPNGYGTRVFDNHFHDNNTENFAAPGNFVRQIPPGSGVILLAAHEVEIFDNIVENHDSLNLGIANYRLITEFDDPEYDPWPWTLHIHDNIFRGESANPTGDLGALLILALSEVQDDVVVPDMVWDGQISPDHADPKDPNRMLPEFNICIQNNGDADWGNMHWPAGDDLEADFDLSPHDCAHEPLPAVTLE